MRVVALTPRGWDPVNNTLHKHVEFYAKVGWPVLPIWWVTKGQTCACGKPGCKAIGKHPISTLAPNGVKNATRDLTVVADWWSRCPNANVAIALGRVSGLVVVDVDGPTGRETLERLLAKYDAVLDSKWFTETGREDGGRHYFFIYPQGIAIPTRKVNGLEVRSDGTYVVAAPSIHRTGRQYTWHRAIAENFMDELPKCLIDFAALGQKVFSRKDPATPSQSTAMDRLQMTHSPPAWSPVKEKRVIAALQFIPADEYDVWLRMGMALRWTTWPQARAIWDEWSKKSAKYDPAGQDKAWASSGRADYAGPVVTLRSLFHLAGEHGYTPQKGRCTSTTIRHSCKAA
jgi:hypothetical protein